MGKGFYKVPIAINEPVKSYKKGSTERNEVLSAYNKMLQQTIDVPMYINGENIRTGNTQRLSNFMLWQLAYTEIFFEKKLWPDFKTRDFKKILNKFKSIKRNFGSI